MYARPTASPRPIAARRAGSKPAAPFWLAGCVLLLLPPLLAAKSRSAGWLARCSRACLGEAQRDDALLIDHDGVASTLFTLKELGNPLIQVRLHEKSRMTLRTFMDEHPEQSFSVWLDDHSIISRPNQPPLSGTTLELRDHDEDGTKILARTAEWSIVLKNGPLPCPVQWTQKASEDDSH